MEIKICNHPCGQQRLKRPCCPGYAEPELFSSVFSVCRLLTAGTASRQKLLIYPLNPHACFLRLNTREGDRYQRGQKSVKFRHSYAETWKWAQRTRRICGFSLKITNTSFLKAWSIGMVTGSPVLQGKIRCTFEALHANSADECAKNKWCAKNQWFLAQWIGN